MNPFPSDRQLEDLLDRCFEALGASSGKDDELRCKRLRHGLINYLELAASVRRSRAVPSPSQLRGTIDRIYQQSGKLLEALGIDPRATQPLVLPREHPTYPQILWELAALVDPEQPERAGYEGLAEQEFREAVRHIRLIRAAALRSKRSLQKRVRQPDDQKRRVTDRLVEPLILILMDIYRQVTNREPGGSYDAVSGSSGGPLVRFLEVCLNEAGLSYSRHTLRRWVSKIKRKDPSRRCAQP